MLNPVKSLGQIQVCKPNFGIPSNLRNSLGMILHLEWFWVLDCEGCCVWSLDAVATGFCMILYFSLCTIHGRVKSCISFVCASKRGLPSGQQVLTQDLTIPDRTQIRRCIRISGALIQAFLFNVNPSHVPWRRLWWKCFRRVHVFHYGSITMINNEANSPPKYHPSTNKKLVCFWLCPAHIFSRHLHHVLCLSKLVGRF